MSQHDTLTQALADIELACTNSPHRAAGTWDENLAKLVHYHARLLATPAQAQQSETVAWLKQYEDLPGVWSIDPMVLLGPRKPQGYEAKYRPVAYCDNQAQQGEPLIAPGAVSGVVDAQIRDQWPTKAQQAGEVVPEYAKSAALDALTIAAPLLYRAGHRVESAECNKAILFLAGLATPTDTPPAPAQPAAQPVQGVPDGWKLVPVEPTEEMLTAAARASMQHLLDCINDPAKAKEVGSEAMCKLTHASRYRSMLTASPTPPAQQPSFSGFVQLVGNEPRGPLQWSDETAQQGETTVGSQFSDLVRMCPDIECGRKRACTRIPNISCMSRHCSEKEGEV